MSDSTNNEEKPEEKINANDDDPYAYLNRGEFSSEAFKIEITNLPKYYGIREIKKLLNEKLKLSSNKIKAPRANSPYLFVCFRNEEDREAAIKIVTGHKWKGNELKAMKAKPSADPLVKKRKQDLDDKADKKVKVEDTRTEEEKLKASTISLWAMKYEDQLSLKQKNIEEYLRNLGNTLSRMQYLDNDKKLLWSRKAKFDGLPCELLKIRYSEKIEGYRNKCSFTVALNEETGLPTVGFRTGAYVDGRVSVAPIHSLIHVPEPMKVAAKVFQDYVRNSDLQVYNREFQAGHFRQLLARTAPNQLMLVVGIHPQNLTKEKISELKQSLIEYFSNGDGKVANVTSLYYEEITKKMNDADVTAAEHLWGDTHIYETINGLKFRISPQAFFQINVPAAEILYNAAIELAQPTETSTILDVCCGTGTIGLCFAKKCNKVLGVEAVAEAIVDAQENAKKNNIENCEFFVGRAEDNIGSICYKVKNEDIIAIVDPPRAGLHKKAIMQLRKVPNIKSIIYISCHPKLAMQNFVDLGRPESKAFQGEPFLPEKAVPVDMFPYTNHSELVIAFKRTPEST